MLVLGQGRFQRIKLRITGSWIDDLSSVYVWEQGGYAVQLCF